MNNVIHQYFKKVFEDHIILVQVDDKNLKGVELVVFPDGKIKKSKHFFEESILDDLKEEGFEKAHALEFNLYLKGLAK